MKILQNLGVEYIFGTSGGAVNDIQDAMTEVKPPIWIQGLHEFDSVCAAVGYALASEKVSVCLIDRVSGVTNALGAFYIAYQNYAPVVIFASQNEPALAGKLSNGKPRAAIHYHTWQTTFTTPWTKWRYELSNLDILPQSIMRAFMVSKTEPQGPTYMGLRQDLMAERVSPVPLKRDISSFSSSGFTADNDGIKKAAKLILEAEKPTAIATNMGRHASSVDILVELSETLGFNVLDGRNFMNFPMSHPNFLGFIGWAGETGKNPHVNKADLIMSVETYYEYPFAPPEKCKKINLGPDPVMIQGGPGGDYGGNPYPSDLTLVGDSAIILKQINSAAKKMMTPKLKRAIKEKNMHNKMIHNKMISEWKKESESHFNDDPVSPHRIALELNKLWDYDTTWINYTITMGQALAHGIFLNKPGTYIYNSSGHLGATSAMAYGIALARPKDKVVATIGEGEFVFGNPASVLWTCSHYRIPVLFLILNNACWGVDWPIIQDATLKLAESKKDYEFVDIDEPRIYFAKLAEGLKVKSKTLSHPDEVAEKFKWGLDLISRGEPALIDIQLEKFTKGKSSYSYIFQRR